MEKSKKARSKFTFTIILALLFVANQAIGSDSFSLNDPGTYKTYKGKVIDKITKKPLVYASVILENYNISTISNSDGDFTLKVSDDNPAKNINISYLGYVSKTIPIGDFTNKRMKIQLTPVSISLNEFEVMPNSADEIVLKMIRNISVNYSSESNMMDAFYRESIKKGRNQVALAEEVVNIYKKSY